VYQGENMRDFETMTTNGTEMTWASEIEAGKVADAISGFVVERMDGTFAVAFLPRAMVAE
tara:strand:+ start:2018 stop:2197 length:180 start_codon:yes stop_codon:yes gene_type:complete